MVFKAGATSDRRRRANVTAQQCLTAAPSRHRSHGVQRAVVRAWAIDCGNPIPTPRISGEERVGSQRRFFERSGASAVANGAPVS
jgi:LDH2 family malate/lactate/ureidoglycolate dehydrogenase